MKSEINDLSRKLREAGLEEHDVDGDGNCLFRAVSHSLFGSDRNHLQLRSQAVDYIMRNEHDFIPFIEEPMSKYVNRMSKSGVYGGNLELVAISKMLDLNIVIYQAQSAPLVIQSCRSSEKTIYLVYYSYEHYASTVKSDFRPPVADANATKKTKEMINQIIKISGYTNVEKIQELLEKNNGKFGLVLDEIYELDQVKDEQEPDKPIQVVKDIKQDCTKIVKSRDRKKLAKTKRKEAALEKKRSKFKGSDTYSSESVASNLQGLEKDLKGIHI